MKKITRNEAVSMFGMLGSMALGHLSDEMLGNVMDNFNEFRKVSDEVQKLNEELTKRLYADVDETRKKEYFEKVNQMDALRTSLATAKTKEQAQKVVRDINDMSKLLKDSYADVDALYVKHTKVYGKLLEKEIEVDIHELDADDFIKGIVRGKKDVPIHEIRASFAPMFKEEKEKETDLSELDELLKEENV